MSDKRIAICTHVFDIVHFDLYFNHLFAMAHWSKKHDIVLVGKSGLQAASARNNIIDKCLEHECSHALFIDGDHLIPYQMLDMLLETGNEAMVSGLVCKKGENFYQVCWDVIDKGNERQFLQLELPLDGRVYEVGICAFGCTLINLDKIQKLKKPYFRDTCEKLPDGSFSNIRSDINLCLMFRDIGERCWVDTRVLVGHFIDKPRVVYPQNAKLFEKLKSIELDSTDLKKDQNGHFYVADVS